MDKLVYFFGNGSKNTEGNASMKETLGGKGANLAEMCRLNIPVPAGFTIRCEVCDIYYKNNKSWPDALERQVKDNLIQLEKVSGKKFGDPNNPLLVSVRSGAAQSLPGMMDTILNLGLNTATVEGLAKKTGNERFAHDSYRRFIQMFSSVALDIDMSRFDRVFEQIKEHKGVEHDTDLNSEDLKQVIKKFLLVVKEESGNEFPQAPEEQLHLAISAVLRSWNNERCVYYREMNDIRGLLGTAVNIQAMVFGNMGDTSGTGVCFTRNPSTGENLLYGEYLMNAQGEDVVAGIRTPNHIDTLQATDPKSYNELMTIRSQLEKHYADMQDIEFTIEEGKLYILQTRNAKRTVFAWLRTCVEMVDEKLIDEATAIKRVPSSEFSKLFNPILDSADIRQKNCKVLTSALNASPGGACGQIYFNAEDAIAAKSQGKKVMLVRMETSPEDIAGMAISEGILTARGGMTSHAAVVARGMGCPCVCGASEMRVNDTLKTMNVGKTTFKEGDFISIDGFSGEVFGDHIEVKPSEITQVLCGDLSAEKSLLATEYLRFMEMIDKYRTLGVRTNADSAKDIKIAIGMGAEGIGLTRTEHMFFDKDRINTMREMILADSKIARVSALKKLLPMQREDFEAIFTTLAGRPATIRLLDPPLHEFLPHGRSNVNALAQSLSISSDWIKRKVSDMKEENPMLGFRGCRIGIVYPEIFDMQIRAIIEAAIHVADRNIPVFPEIMIPLIGHVKELKILKDRAINVIAEVFREYSKEIPYKIGTMIEVPRAALTADEIATEAEFFSFGTNDLTQMTCGFSRDDSGSFLPHYVKEGIYDYDPFAVLDQSGVGKLMIEAIKLGRSVRPDIKLGICGEHGGDPKTVAFCHDIGLDYVSCSPYRVPVARLAAAQAAIK